jgi:hypothetical protein
MPDRLDFVLEALKDVPARDRLRVLHDVRRIGPDARIAADEFAATLPEAERMQAVRELSRD